MVYKRRTKEQKMFYGAKPETFEKAKVLRMHMTEAEKLLWSVLRRKQLQGCRFRRQHPIGQFIADFYCHEKQLVIEVDGGVHLEEEQKEYDEGRNHEMQHWGIKILRFTNEEITKDLDNVIGKIMKYLPLP